MNISNSYCLACTTKPTQFEDEPKLRYIGAFLIYKSYMVINKSYKTVFLWMAFCDIWQKMVMRNADGVLLLQKKSRRCPQGWS